MWLYLYFTLDSRINRLLRRLRPKSKQCDDVPKELVDSAADVNVVDDNNFVVSQLTNTLHYITCQCL